MGLGREERNYRGGNFPGRSVSGNIRVLDSQAWRYPINISSTPLASNTRKNTSQKYEL